LVGDVTMLQQNQQRDYMERVVYIGAKGTPNMPLPIPLAVVLFLTIWFVVLFAVLPFGVRSQHESGDYVPGTDPGAPVEPRLLIKALWTTFLSLVVFGLIIGLMLHLK
jgi:predicted secreted protein